jgi:uncharacterized protein (TIGR03435 family)
VRFLGVFTLGLFFAASLCPLAQIAPAQGVTAPPPAQAASPAPSTTSLKYDIVSVRPAEPNAHYRGGSTTPDETEIVLSLKALVGYVYDIRPEFVFGGPKWCDTELFDIKAKVDESDIATFESLSYQQRATMLRPILESRFGLKVHHEVRVLQVFDLVLAKVGLGPKFSPHSPDKPAFSLGSVGGDFDGYGVEMPLFTKALTNELLATIGRPIIDKIGLTGKYDFYLRWSSAVTTSSPTDQAATSSHPDIFTAMQEQLGLKLQPAREQVETIVIDSAAQPSEN